MLIIILVFSKTLFGQKDSTRLSPNGDPINRLSIETSPLNLIDGFYGCLATLGAEVRVTDKIACYTEYGLYVQNRVLGSPEYQNRGYMIKEEIKKFLPDPNHETTGYLDLQLCYSRQAYNRVDSVISAPNTTYKYKSYWVQKNFPGIAILGGVQWVKFSRLVIDLYFGVGLRLNSVETALTPAEANSRQLGDWTVPFTVMETPGTHIIGNTNLGVKIGYRIK